jgi:hypothetical protein
VGQNPLFNRGMNAAPAIFGNYLYVGNRSDGSNTCPDGTTGCTHVHPDPNNANRALLWISTPTISADPKIPNLMVVDISQVPGGGPVREVAQGNWNDQYPGTDQPNYPFDPNSPTGCGRMTATCSSTPWPRPLTAKPPS